MTRQQQPKIMEWRLFSSSLQTIID